jgi:alkylation response protein AidB-like acyl-CoA dehydrogenase
MEKRIILANTLTVLGCLIGVLGLAAMALWSEYEKTGSPELAAVLTMLKAFHPPGFLVPICSHLVGGAMLALLGEWLRRKAVREKVTEQVRAGYFQNV